jgi:esterase/lipase superfamily enzyme
MARVFPGYATNRELSNGVFTGNLAAEVSYGFCDVTLPPDHNPGKLERPAGRWWWYDEPEDPAKHVVLREIGHVDANTFFEHLRETSPEAVLLFVHGFNVTFEESALRTAQLHHDLRFPGQSLFFSWASDGEVSGYANDATKIGDSVEDIAKFVDSLAENEGVDAIYMIGHSMGSRGLARALVSVGKRVSKNAQEKLRELILVEPDISQQIFETRIVPGLRELGARVTIYASENDKALGISEPVNNDVPRLGQAGAHLYVSERIDTIDSSDVGVSFLSLNHSAYAENLEFLLELAAVIDGKPSEARLGLEWRQDHWYLVPAN